MKKHKTGVFDAVKTAALTHRGLTAVTLLCVAASVIMSLIPPLLLARIIDRLTGGMPLAFLAVLLYFGSLVLESILSSAQEALLVLFGQKMTHALRSEMSQKLTQLPASTLAAQNPGEVAARFSGDVDTVEALFTSGIISMAADACRIVSILAVIAVKNAGLALICCCWFCRCLPCLPVMYRSGCWQPSWIIAGRWRPCPGRCRRPFITFGRSGRWDWKAIWNAGMTDGSGRAMGPWREPIFTMPFILRWCSC